MFVKEEINRILCRIMIFCMIQIMEIFENYIRFTLENLQLSFENVNLFNDKIKFNNLKYNPNSFKHKIAILVFS